MRLKRRVEWGSREKKSRTPLPLDNLCDRISVVALDERFFDYRNGLGHSPGPVFLESLLSVTYLLDEGVVCSSRFLSHRRGSILFHAAGSCFAGRSSVPRNVRFPGGLAS